MMNYLYSLLFWFLGPLSCPDMQAAEDYYHPSYSLVYPKAMDDHSGKLWYDIVTLQQEIRRVDQLKKSLENKLALLKEKYECIYGPCNQSYRNNDVVID